MQKNKKFCINYSIAPINIQSCVEIPPVMCYNRNAASSAINRMKQVIYGVKTMYRLFIVEDDDGIAGGIVSQASTWGMETACADDFQNVISQFSAVNPHIVLLDISLPFYNGYHWCSQIRRISSVPIIFISSASDSMNIIMAMNMGADDFITKPFDMSVLMAKVMALLRRTYDFSQNTELREHKGAILNLSDSSLTYNGEKISLSKNEFKILCTLMEQKGKVVSREKLMDTLWETDCFVDENTLSVNVNRLRRRLEGAGLSGFIRTKHGVGYIIEK